MPKIVALAGGVGGARLCDGLAALLGGALTVIVNTGDDFDHLGLRICPDIDTVSYTLAGIGDTVNGWGVGGESYAFMAAARKLGAPDWFTLGDQDLAAHVLRTHALQQGSALHAVIADFTRRLGISATVLPMSDESVATVVHTEEGILAFQDYFVRLRANPRLVGLTFDGALEAEPAPGVLDALCGAPDAIVLCPSNPLLSIEPILSVPGIRQAICDSNSPKIAVSPIIGGQAIKGPAAKILAELGMEVSALGVARIYQPFLHAMVIDHRDAALAHQIKELGIVPIIAQTLMKTRQDRIDLAQTIVDAIPILSL